MSFLLDTNVISESARPRPDAAVMQWLASVDESQLFLSIFSVAELRHGIERLEPGHRKDLLDVWLSEQLTHRFGDRLLGADVDTAHHWGRIVAQAQTRGRPIGAMDAFIAAIATQHHLTVVTRNTRDFEAIDVRVFNPWR